MKAHSRLTVLGVSSGTTAHKHVRDMDKLVVVQGQVADAKGKMAANIVMVVKNTKTLEEMDEKARELQKTADDFERQARALHRKMWWHNCKWKLVMGLIVATGLTVIGVIIWQTTKSDDRRRLLGKLLGMGER